MAGELGSLAGRPGKRGVHPVILQFGKYRGYDALEVPSSYLRWLEQIQTRDLDELRSVMEARGLWTSRPTPKVVYQTASSNPGPLVQEMIRTGYKTLAKRYHPDLGGDTRLMQELNRAFEAWTDETSSR